MSMNVNVYQDKEKFKVTLSDEYTTKLIKWYDNLSDVYDFAKEMFNRYNTFVSIKFRKNLMQDELTGTQEEVSTAYELINTAIELLEDLDEEYRVSGFLMNWEKLRAISYARQDINEAIREHKKASYFIEHKNSLSPKHILDCIEITEKRLKD